MAFVQECVLLLTAVGYILQRGKKESNFSSCLNEEMMKYCKFDGMVIFSNNVWQVFWAVDSEQWGRLSVAIVPPVAMLILQRALLLR